MEVLGAHCGFLGMWLGNVNASSLAEETRCAHQGHRTMYSPPTFSICSRLSVKQGSGGCGCRHLNDCPHRSVVSRQSSVRLIGSFRQVILLIAAISCFQIAFDDRVPETCSSLHQRSRVCRGARAFTR